MNRWFFSGALGAIGALIALGALGAAGFDRFKDHVVIGQGTSSEKKLEFDIGEGASNPKIIIDSTGSVSFNGLVPTGSVIPFAGSTSPDGWLLADGSAISRSTYARLFAAIGTTYGAGNGSTTFNLPDMRGRVAAGRDDMGGSGANRLTSGVSGIDGDSLGDAGGHESMAHTHNIAHAHQWAFWRNGFSEYNSLLSLNDSETSIGAVDSNFVQGTTSGSGSGDLLESTLSSDTSLYTSGVLSPPTGAAGATASSGGVNPVNAGGNAQPTIVLNYIIKS